MRKTTLEYQKVDPKSMKGMMELESYVRGSDLEPALIELVKMRASQINGCGYCLDMHSKDARAAGETEQRLYTLSVWNETNFFSERERAALAWTEVLTRISEHEVTDELYEEIQSHFSEKEMVVLTTAIIAINSWNRLAIGFGNKPGSYKPEMAK
jgi:AhpD family alkylhydroperoxidase